MHTQTRKKSIFHFLSNFFLWRKEREIIYIFFSISISYLKVMYSKRFRRRSLGLSSTFFFFVLSFSFFCPLEPFFHSHAHERLPTTPSSGRQIQSVLFPRERVEKYSSGGDADSGERKGKSLVDEKGRAKAVQQRVKGRAKGRRRLFEAWD